MANEPAIHVTVVFAPAARQVMERELTVAAGCILARAIEQSGVLGDRSGLQAEGLQFGVWGRKAAATRVLRDGDRVEVYRALAVDPKLARKERFLQQGAGTTGLFARRRPGAKSGY